MCHRSHARFLPVRRAVEGHPCVSTSSPSFPFSPASSSSPQSSSLLETSSRSVPPFLRSPSHILRSLFQLLFWLYIVRENYSRLPPETIFHGLAFICWVGDCQGPIQLRARARVFVQDKHGVRLTHRNLLARGHMLSVRLRSHQTPLNCFRLRARLPTPGTCDVDVKKLHVVLPESSYKLQLRVTPNG